MNPSNPPMHTKSVPSRYSGVSVIAEGGSGRVYRVRDSVREADLALKLVNSEEAAWLRREFDVLRHIRHENLVQVFDWGTVDAGGAYYTMELVEGGDWSHRKGSVQRPEEVRAILTSLLRGLAHLHSHGEIHGDLKPANILLGAGGVLKVSDVGMGGAADTPSGTATPGFAAPEIWEGAKHNVQSDIYSVGVMAYEALTGRHPFEGRTVREVVSGQLEGWVPSPRVHGIALPADLERSVMRALERSPALRHASVDEFLEDLGVEDRVGAILGGRFVDRDRELSDLSGYLRATAPDTPTVALVCGPPGVGKTALLGELADQCFSEGQAVLHVRRTDLTKALSTFLVQEDDKFTPANHDAPVSSISEGLWRVGARNPLLVWVDNSGEDDAVTQTALQLGRFLSALASERGVASHVLLVVELRDIPREEDGMSRVMPLEPLDRDGTEELAVGFLGNLRLEPSQVHRLHAATGGLPSAVLDLTTDLIARGVLVRRAGEWSLRDVEEHHEFRYTRVPSRVELGWNQLSGPHKRLLTAIAPFEHGVGVGSLSGVIQDASAGLQVLASKGWIEAKSGRVAAASQGVRSATLQLAAPAERMELERLLLADSASGIDSSDRAAVLLRHPELPEALTLGLASTRASFEARQYGRAAENGEKCLHMALERGDREAAKQAWLLTAEALLRLGRYDDAKRLLGDDRPNLIPDDEPTLGPRRERLLGSIHLEQGHLAKAREHLSRSIELADATGNRSLSLQSQADLADLDWRYGDEALRAKSMARVKDVIGKIPDTRDLRDEQAALVYQLGSALIMSGRREEAVGVLQSALRHEPGDYWRMRIANAMGTAEYYLGHFDAALMWGDEARRLAESSGSDSYKARIHSNRAGVYYGLGRFQDAVEHHGLSAMWAKRTGSMVEYQAASSGASINLTITGRYEEAMHWAQESERATRLTGDEPELAKSYELEALATYYIGDLDGAERLTTLGLAQARKSSAEVTPRLEWLAAQVAIAKGDWRKAENHLVAALTILEVSKDWEDLPGVQIEIQLLAFRKKDPGFDLKNLIGAAIDAERRGTVLVFLRAALVIGEVLLDLDVDHAKGREILERALGRAEVSGAGELSWRLSYLIGEIDARKGDLKSASSRHGHALRGLREIADRLSPQHRASYLQTPHARALLLRLGGAG